MRALKKKQVNFALTKLNDYNLVKDDTVSGKLKGYVSTFSGTLVIVGFIPGILLYSKESDRNHERFKVFKIINDMVWNATGYPDNPPESKELMRMIVELSLAEQNHLKKRYMDAASILKLSLRMYKFEQE